MKNLEGKVTLISGAARGKGAAEARIFVERGAKVMLCDVLDTEGEQTAADIGDSTAYIHLDVTRESDWQAAIAGPGSAVGGVTYCASKFAVRGMTKVAAMELGPDGIRVNSIHPGGIMTRMLTDAGLTGESADALFSKALVGRIGQPEEMATLAIYLASDDSSYSIGSEFVADGGLTAGFALEG